MQLHLNILSKTILFLLQVIYCLQQKENAHIIKKRKAISVGHTETLNISTGATLKIKTLSLSPPIFEIKDFLSAEECSELIDLAQEKGLTDSPTHPQTKHFTTTKNVFRKWDTNRNGFVEPLEFTYIKGKYFSDRSVESV